MWFANHKAIHVALDALIADLRRSSARLEVWEADPRLFPDEGLSHVLSTLRGVLDDNLAMTTEVSVALSFAQVTPRQVARNLKPAQRLAKQISDKLNELDGGAAFGRAVFKERYGISSAQD